MKKNITCAPAVIVAMAAMSLCGCIGTAKTKIRTQMDNHCFPFETEASKAFVDSLYDRMSVQERAAQLYSIQPQDIMVDGKVSPELCREKIPYGIGHVCQFSSNLDVEPAKLLEIARQIQDYLISETPAGIPAVLHEECISGFTAKGATIYPQQIGMACTWNPALARVKTSQTAKAMRSVGVTMALSPMTDIIRNASWCRGEESYGEDAYLSASMASAFVEGLQGGDLRTGVAACTKHFLGYGGGSELPWERICEEVLFPHEVCIRQAGSKAVMTCYDQFRGEQAVTSDTLINVLLRKGMGFDGVVVSDYLSIGYMGNDPESLKKTAALALNTGNDLEFCNGDNYQYLPELLEAGLVDAEAFEKCVKRALTLKYDLGLFDRNHGFVENPLTDLDPKEWRETSYLLATQSVVMLKNDGVLPLDGTKGRIALVGPNANAFCAMLGDYTFPSMNYFWRNNEMDPETPHIVTLREGLSDKLKGAALKYARGCDWSVPGELSLNFGGDPRIRKLTSGLVPQDEETDWDKAVALAAGSDVIIAAMGENPALCGEGRERKGINLPGRQQEFVKQLITTGKPVVLVIFGGRPQCVAEIADGCAAILQAWYPGEEGGNAIADILVGNVSPSGKLAITYPAHERDGQFCYLDEDTDGYVAWPFGYGLSYTTFKCDLKQHDTRGEVVCTVQNTGTMEGDEVVQIYLERYLMPQNSEGVQVIMDDADLNDTPKGRLMGFARVSLKPGEMKKITFRLYDEQLAECVLPSGAPGEDSYWLVRPGTYMMSLRTSLDTKHFAMIVDKEKTIPFGGRNDYLSRHTIDRIYPMPQN